MRIFHIVTARIPSAGRIFVATVLSDNRRLHIDSFRDLFSFIFSKNKWNEIILIRIYAVFFLFAMEMNFLYRHCSNSSGTEREFLAIISMVYN